MPEVPQPAQEIEVMRSWIDQEVIGQGICPPLVRLAQQYKKDDGSTDWDKLSPLVQFSSYRQFNPSSQTLLYSAANNYVYFITEANNGTDVLTSISILPDFPTNRSYDTFITAMKEIALRQLLSSTRGQKTLAEVFQKVAKTQNLPDELIQLTLDSSEAGLVNLGLQVVEGAFNPVNFYGRELSDKDVADFPLTRGAKDRYKILSRAPYYAFQNVNALTGHVITQDLNRQRIHQRNTTLALSTDISQYEASMDQLKEEEK